MAESDGEDRTEEATQKRVDEAREKGQIPRSKELNNFAGLVAAAALILMLGGNMMRGLEKVMRDGLTPGREAIFEPSQMLSRLADAAFEVLWLFAPFFGAMIVVGIAAAVALGGWTLNPGAFTPNLGKLDPIKGFGRIVSWKGIVEMLKSLAKFVVLAVAAVMILRRQTDGLLGLGLEPVESALGHSGSLLAWSFLYLSLSLLLLVLVDVPFQIWDHNRQMKMTKQEVRDEYKESEGRPEVKGKIRKLQNEMAQRRMMAEVPKADVVITNPSHYAVALKYDQAKNEAPVLVAKGTDLIALQIRNVAKENRVAVVEAPPLARALYHSTELDRPIPVGLYRAVAQILAYVYQLRQGPIYDRSGSVDFKNLEIPPELRRDS